MHRSAMTGKRLSDMQVFAPMQHMRSDSFFMDALSREELTIIGREKNQCVDEQVLSFLPLAAFVISLRICRRLTGVLTSDGRADT